MPMQFRTREESSKPAAGHARLNYRLIHEQHPGAQQPLGFVARIKALMNLFSTCGAMASTSRPSPDRKARASSTSYTRVGSISIAAKPAALSLASYTLHPAKAPAMQPTQSNMLLRTSSGTAPFVTTSETAKRPPGLRTRNASRRLGLYRLKG